MGMFDDLWCDRPLPDGYEGRHFQTKDLDCAMDRYKITADGDLEVLRFDLEPDGAPGPHPLFEEIQDWQKYKRVNERWERVFHHGDIWFYSYSEGDHEYRARFTEGRLASLVSAVDLRGAGQGQLG